MKKTRNLTKDPVGGLFFHYLLPAVSASLVTSIYIFADTIMIGKGIGAEGLAALNVVLPLFNLFFAWGLLFGIGGSVLMSVSFGEGKIKQGQKYFTVSTGCAGIMAVLLWIVFWVWFTPIMKACGATEELMLLVSEYGRIIVAGLPVFMATTFLENFIRNDKNPVLVMIAVISGGVLNVIFDYIFIFLCHMGMHGTAIATVMGSGTTVMILLLHFVQKKNHLKFVSDSFRWKSIQRIIFNGLASFVVEISSGIVICLFNIQLVRYVGAMGIAVYGIVSNTALIAMSLANGAAQAAQPIIAVNFGAGEKKRIQKVACLAFLTELFVGFLMMTVGEIMPLKISQIYVELSSEMEKMAIPAVRIYFISFLFMAGNVFFTSYFQATLCAKQSLVLSLLRGILLVTLFILLLPVFFGVKGIWSVMPISEVLTFLVAILFLLQKRAQSGKQLSVMKKMAVLLCVIFILGSLLFGSIFLYMKKNRYLKPLTGRYDALETSISDGQDLTYFSLEIYGDTFSLYDGTAGNPGIEGEIVNVTDCKLIVDPSEYFEDGPKKWQKNAEGTLEIYYKLKDGQLVLSCHSQELIMKRQ